MDTPEQHAETTEDIAKAQVATEKVAATNGHVESSPAERQSHNQLFQHSRFVHVGPGAEECPDVDEEKFVSSCGNPLHFHAWIRTPNQFQHNSLRTKALAAKARKLRALHDPESDVRTVLEGDLEVLQAVGAKDALVEEIVAKDGVKAYWQAVREVQEEEEYEHFEEDRDRYSALAAKPEEERDEEELERLTKHLENYRARVKEVIADIERPLRQSLESKTIEELISIVREDRIQGEAHQEFDDSYSLWEWYIGTLRLRKKEAPGHPNERVYGDIEELKAAPSEVISALSEAFMELDAEAGRALGNS
jgi:hypothetical protein